MSDDNKTQEFLQKLTPCIARSDLDACVEEAARMAREMGVEAEELLDLSSQEGRGGKHDFAYVIALAAAQGLEGEAKAEAYFDAGLMAQSIQKLENAEEQYKQVIAIRPKYAEAYCNYANVLTDLNRIEEAEEQYKMAIAADQRLAAAYGAYSFLLIDLDRREEALEQIEKASDLLFRSGCVMDSHLAKASFYQEISEKNLAGSQELHDACFYRFFQTYRSHRSHSHAAWHWADF